MVKTNRNDKLFDEQKRSGQEGSNINDPNGNDLVTKHRLTPKNQAYRNDQRCLRQKDLPLGINFDNSRSNTPAVCF